MLPYSNFAIFIALLDLSVGNWVTAYGFRDELVSNLLDIITVIIIITGKYWETYITKIDIV